MRTLYNDAANDFFKYVEDNWIINSMPLFKSEIWSQYGKIRGRTNNSAESFHSKINRAINNYNLKF